MALIAILRHAGATIMRAPLLWFFSAVVLLTSTVPSMGLGGSLSWLECLSLLLIPITGLAEAGQIRSVQLCYEGTPTSISQIIRHGAHRMGPLIVVLVINLLLMFILIVVLAIVARLLLQHVLSPDVAPPLLTIVSAITYAFTAFAQCAIVISDLPLRSSLPMVFRVIKKEPLTILTLVTLVGVLSYFIGILFPITPANFVHAAGYLLAFLILGGIESTVFTFAYIYYAGEAN
ncbi:MAG: hypothetical protein ABSE06_14110 [Anaerolineaceae bacterium]|jgi:hypothetical protein